MKKMMTALRVLSLLIPLIWYLNLWLGFMFDIGLSDDVIGKNAGQFISDFTWILMLFIGTPLTFIVGVIYTFYKKYWLWLTAYLILGGIPVCVYFIGVTGANLGLL